MQTRAQNSVPQDDTESEKVDSALPTRLYEGRWITSHIPNGMPQGSIERAKANVIPLFSH